MIFEIEEVLQIHDILIQEFGGITGIRDQAGLESALQRPLQTFDGNELYSSTEEKAAALLESIVVNHPFIDGNKRLGYVLMRLFLMQEGLDISASESEKYQLVIDVATGSSDVKMIALWIQTRKKKFL